MLRKRKKLKIAITGAQSTGKSTLLDALKKEYKDVQFIEEITRDLKAQGYKINEEGNDDTQVQIMNLHKKYCNSDENVIYDRCALDGIVYTHYLYNQGNISEDVFQKSLDIFHEIINSYDKICYLKPEFDIVDDGERSINETFRDEIVDLFNWYIYFYSIPVIMLTGSVEARVQQFKEVFNDTRN